MKAISTFKKAAGAKLNKNKTKIYGIGSWNGKIEWPLPWIQNSLSSFSSLGIIYSNDYQSSVNLNWENVLNSIQTKVRTLQSIQLTIYQRSIILNCIIYSKIWYVAHIFPLPVTYANKLKRIGFNYIWARNNYEPVKRSTLSLPKNEGGLGIIDILYKSQSILAKSFIKLYLNESNISFMAEYYTSLRVGQLFDMHNHYDTVSYTGTEYYSLIISIIRKCIHVRGFPLLNAKQIYSNIMPTVKPTIESIYQTYKWKTIWSNLCSAFVLPKEREVIFKFLHEVLPTRKRLKEMKKAQSSACNYCGQEESNIHLVSCCPKTKDVIVCLGNMLRKYCNLDNIIF